MNMIRLFTIKTLLLILLIPFAGSSQVQDLSYTLSPMGEYILWGDKAGLKDGIALGGKLGFGFGQYVELSGTYLQALDLQTDFSDFGIPGYAESAYSPRDVNWQRYGGELRLNLSKGTLLPFLTMGSGIQRTELEVPQFTNILNEQIYIDLGAGVVLSLADRYTLSVAVKNNQYRFNAVRDLMTSSDYDALGISAEDYKTETVVNWGLNASLQFYIGGRNPKEMTAIDRAYQRTFGDGLRGVSVPIEPVAGKINFHDNLPYRNTWYAGGHIGIDLGSYIGLRGFYWRAMEEDKFQNFDDLSLYGGEAKFNLSSGQGITPFLTIGGGYLNVGNDYIPRDGMVADDQPFAMGGAGLTLPLSPYFNVFGGARAILLTQEDLDDLAQPGDVLTSWNYHFGLRLIIGQKATSPERLVQENIDIHLNEQQEEYQSALNKLREEYQNEISRLRQEKDLLKMQNDSIRQMKKPVEGTVDTAAEKREMEQPQEKDQQPERSEKRDTFLNKTIHLSPAEFGELMKIMTRYGIEMKKMDVEEERIRSRERILSRSQGNSLPPLTDEIWRDTLLFNNLMDTSGMRSMPLSPMQFQRMLRDAGRDTSILDGSDDQTVNRVEARGNEVDPDTASGELDQIKLEYENKISGYRDEIDDKEDIIQNLQLDLEEHRNKLQRERIAADSLRKSLYEIDPEKRFRSDSTFAGRLYYKGLTGIGGVTFGRQTNITLGFRSNFGIRGTDFRLLTETYAGIGSESMIGLAIDGVYDFRIAREGALSRFTPYIGIGVGLQQPGSKDGLQGTYGIILGAELQLWDGKAFVDYTMRNIFDYNQVILGYKFPF